MRKSIIIAVDANERTFDALALGHLLTSATRAPPVLMSVLAYHALSDPGGAELEEVREQARATMLELAQAEGSRPPRRASWPATCAARAAARDRAARRGGHRGRLDDGPVGRLLPGVVAERLPTGAACPVAIAPREYAGRRPEWPARVGVGVDESGEAREAFDAALALADAAGARLRVITAFGDDGFGALAAAALPGAAGRHAMRELLQAAHEEAVAAQARARVEVEDRFEDGSPEDVLAAHSDDLDLLVIGSRG